MTATFAAMLLSDARLPTGGHTQSGGLEAAFEHGMTVDQIPDFLTARIAGVVRVDAGTAVVAMHRLATGGALEPVLQAWQARTPNQHQRDAAALLGRGWLRLLRSQWPGAAATAAVAALGSVPRPLVVAAVARQLAMSPAQLVELICYDDVATVTAAALKLQPLDPLQTVGWARGVADLAQVVVDELAGALPVVDPEDIPATSAPQLEAWLHAHARNPRRLFRA